MYQHDKHANYIFKFITSSLFWSQQNTAAKPMSRRVARTWFQSPSYSICSPFYNKISVYITSLFHQIWMALPCPALWIANAMTILFDLQLSATYCYETLICKLSEMMMDDFLQKSILICCQVNCNFFCFSCLLNLLSFTDSVHIKYQINKTLNP